jgi:hypothetical protein
VSKEYEIKRVKRDGEIIVKLKCPKCGLWGDLDKDQFFGMVSVLCDCGFHETINFSSLEQKRGEK